jgi:hypothetical protein
LIDAFARDAFVRQQAFDIPIPKWATAEAQDLALELNEALQSNRWMRVAVQQNRLIGFYQLPIDPTHSALGFPPKGVRAPDVRTAERASLDRMISATGIFVGRAGPAIRERLRSIRKEILLSDPKTVQLLDQLAARTAIAEAQQRAAAEAYSEVLKRHPSWARILPLEEKYRRLFTEGSLARIRKAGPSFRDFRRSVVNRVFGIATIATVGYLVVMDAIDSWESRNAYSPEACARNLGRLVSDTSFSTLLWFLGAHPVGLAISVTAGVGLECAHRWANADIPTLSDFNEASSKIFGDTFLLLRQLYRASINDPDLIEDGWMRWRQQIPTVSIQREREDASARNATNQGELGGDELLAALSGNLQRDAEEPPETVVLDFSPEGFAKEVSRIAKPKPELAIQVTESAEIMSAFSRLTAAYAANYLRLAFATLQFLGDHSNPKTPVSIGDHRIVGARLPVSVDLFADGRDRVLKRLQQELASFLNKFEISAKAIRPYERILTTPASKLIPRHLESVAHAIENCLELDENGEPFARSPCTPSPASLRAAKELTTIAAKLSDR